LFAVFILNVSSRLNPEGKKTTRSYKQGDNKQTNKKKGKKKVFLSQQQQQKSLEKQKLGLERYNKEKKSEKLIEFPVPFYLFSS